MKNHILIIAIALLLSACSASEPDTATIDDNAIEINWEMLQKIDLETGAVPESLVALEGKLVKLPGFIAPVDADGAGQITEFVIVPYAGACIHVPPPPPNEMVLVTNAPLRSELDIEGYGLYIPYWFYGTLQLTRLA